MSIIFDHFQKSRSETDPRSRSPAFLTPRYWLNVVFLLFWYLNAWDTRTCQPH